MINGKIPQEYQDMIARIGPLWISKGDANFAVADMIQVENARPLFTRNIPI